MLAEAGGYYAEVRLYPELGLGSVILLNRSGVTDERVLDEVDRPMIRKKNDTGTNPALATAGFRLNRFGANTSLRPYHSLRRHTSKVRAKSSIAIL